MSRKLNWQAFTVQDRNKAIDELKGIILSNGGHIVNSSLFSDLALSLTIEIEEKNILQLHSRLKDSLTISESGTENLISNSTNEWWIYLNVTFSQGKGNLKIEVPDVPG